MLQQSSCRRVAALGIATVVALAACGDDSSDDGASEADAAAEADDGSDAQSEGTAAADGGESTDDEDREATDGDAGADDDGEPVVVEHALGEATIESVPEQVVVFDIGALLTLDELGVEASGVPEATYPDSLSHYADGDAEMVGSLFEPDFEAVNALDPDLIIIGGRSATEENYDQLEGIAPTIDVSVDNTDFMTNFNEQTRVLGEIFDAQDEVDDALAELDESIAAIEERADSAGNALFVMTNAGEVAAYGPGSRFGLVHDEMGVAPADPDIEDSSHGNVVSFEYILDNNPDTLYVLDRDAAIGEGGDAAEQVLDNELVAQTEAWSSDDVYYLDPFTWYIAPTGLPSVRTMIDEIEASLGD